MYSGDKELEDDRVAAKQKGRWRETRKKRRGKRKAETILGE